MSPIGHLNGIDLHFEELGEGPPVVLSHGYSATCEMWAPQVEGLSERHRVVTWDMRGHGETASPDDPAAYSHAATVADLDALLDHLEIDEAVIGGLSLGGFVSLAYYLAHPQRVRALVIADTGPGYRNPEARARWNETAEARAVDLEERGLEVLSDATPERRSAIRRHRSARGLALAARGMLTQHDDRVINALPQIEVPVLIVVGADDKPYLAPSEYMARKIPHARLEVIQSAGHAANLDQPERFNQVLRSFLDALP